MFRITFQLITFPFSQNPENDNQEWNGFESHVSNKHANDFTQQNASLVTTTTSNENRTQNTTGSSNRSNLKMKQTASLESDFASLDVKNRTVNKKNNNPAEDDLWNMLNN